MSAAASSHLPARGRSRIVSNGGSIDRRGRVRGSLRRPSDLTASPATRLPRRCSPTASRLVGRSFKYHRPRGILTAGPEEPNALVELRSGARREPNTRATTSSCTTGSRRRARTAGRRCASICCAVNSLLAPFFPAGFYYKTFMWPAVVLGARLRAADPPRRRAWARRRRAPIPTTTSRRTPSATCWSSAPAPAGLAAALAAARAGARVILCEEDFIARRAPAGRRSRDRRRARARVGRARSSPNCVACPTCG